MARKQSLPAEPICANLSRSARLALRGNTGGWPRHPCTLLGMGAAPRCLPAASSPRAGRSKPPAALRSETASGKCFSGTLESEQDSLEATTPPTRSPGLCCVVGKPSGCELASTKASCMTQEPRLFALGDGPAASRPSAFQVVWVQVSESCACGSSSSWHWRFHLETERGSRKGEGKRRAEARTAQLGYRLIPDHRARARTPFFHGRAVMASQGEQRVKLMACHRSEQLLAEPNQLLSSVHPAPSRAASELLPPSLSSVNCKHCC